jgi:RHS repeat-associated protein
MGSVAATMPWNSQRIRSVQEFDPWGTVRSFTPRISETDANDTGQTLDDTGLLFYNARYYDPGLARFISADPIAPQREQPQSRNRYSYVLNNPLNWVDPTGYCAEGYDRTYAGCERYMHDHGWQLQLADWELTELFLFAEAIYDLKVAAGWSAADYWDALTANRKYTLHVDRLHVSTDDPNRPADAPFPNERGELRIRLFDVLFKSSAPDIRVVMVHEMAHVWDHSTGGKLSNNMMAATGSRYEGNGTVYLPVGGASSAYTPNHLEDWAETVAAAVYPKHPNYTSRSTGKLLMGESRQNYIRSFLPNSTIFRKPPPGPRPQ